MKKLLMLFLLLPFFSDGQIVTNFAGGGSTLGDGGPATASIINDPAGIVFDNVGNLYIASGNADRIRKIAPSGIITTIAGTGVGGYTGDNGPATAAKIKFPSDIVFDTVGNIFFGDFQNYVIRRIDITTGIITTVCGNGTMGYSGDNGPATAAIITSPDGLCFDHRGNLYIADGSKQVVRKINTSGIITTFAGTTVQGYNGDGIPATAAQLNYPLSIQADTLGNIYISDQGNYRIRKVNTAGIISTFAGNGIATYTGDGGPATNAQFIPTFIKFDKFQNLYITGDYRIDMIDAAGIFHTIAGTGVASNTGDGGPATAATFYSPEGLALDSCNNLYVSISNVGRIRKITFDTSCGHSSTLTVSSTSPGRINIFPNPTTKNVTITSRDKISEIVITNIVGQAVFTKAYNAVQVQIDVADLPKGMYFIKVNSSEIRKLVKE